MTEIEIGVAACVTACPRDALLPEDRLSDLLKF